MSEGLAAQAPKIARPLPALAPIAVIYAHPYPLRSVANRALLKAIRGAKGVAIRSLYDLYPDFDVDVEAEQAALAAAEVVVWHHPFYWYSAPALLKLWFEKVLTMGWAYGRGGDALVGKRCLWVTTTGAGEESYATDGMHAHPFEAYVPVISQTARFCRMEWLEPIVVHGAHQLTKDDLKRAGHGYRDRLDALHAEILERRSRTDEGGAPVPADRTEGADGE